MLSITRKADYAILAMAELARRDPTRLSARELAEATEVPLPMLTNVLHQLLHHGLVHSVLGSKGGYSLARAASQITLVDLIGAVEGQFKLAACCEDEPEQVSQACELAGNCRIKGPVRRVHDSLLRFLSEVSLAYIAFDEVPLGGIMSVETQKKNSQTTVAIE